MAVNVNEPMSLGASNRLGIRRPCLNDFPAIVAIANWAICHTAANFKHEPDTLEHWVDVWKANQERYPWLVAERDGAALGFAMASPFHSR